MGTTRKRNQGRVASANPVAAHVERGNPNTTSLEMARMWETAYAELVAFEQKLLNRVHKRIPSLSESARHEAELTDVPMIVEHLQTFKYSLAFWHGSRLELEEEV